MKRRKEKEKEKKGKKEKEKKGKGKGKGILYTFLSEVSILHSTYLGGTVCTVGIYSTIYTVCAHLSYCTVRTVQTVQNIANCHLTCLLGISAHVAAEWASR